MEFVDVNDPEKGLLATLQGFIKAMPTDEQWARSEVRRLCPDYPGIDELNMRQCVWALSSSLEGTDLACNDLHAYLKKAHDVLYEIACGTDVWEREEMIEAARNALPEWYLESRGRD